MEKGANLESVYQLKECLMLCLKELRHVEAQTESCVTWLHPYKNRLSIRDVRSSSLRPVLPEAKIILHENPSVPQSHNKSVSGL
jgi:hypothetical protein